jgi:hypothetical protein
MVSNWYAVPVKAVLLDEMLMVADEGALNPGSP